MIDEARECCPCREELKYHPSSESQTRIGYHGALNFVQRRGRRSYIMEGSLLCFPSTDVPRGKKPLKISSK